MRAKLRLLILTVSERCVGWIQKRTVFMVQTLFNQLKGRSNFSLNRYLQVKHLQHMTSSSSCNARFKTVAGL